MSATIDAAPTRDLLRELAAGGYSLACVAARTGGAPQTLSAIRSGTRTRIRPYIADEVAAVHRRLAGTDPADHGVPPHDTAVTRLIAARNRWTAP